MEALTIHPKNKEQLDAVTSVLKVLKIPFKKEESPYDPEFVKMIRNAEKNREGSIILKTEDDLENYFKSLEQDVQA
jgi:hypothetical protein